jgi:hypothetical protein
MPPDVLNPNVRADDLRREARGRRSFWLATLVLVGLIALLGVASYMGWNRIAEGYVPPRFGEAAAYLLALVPGLLWLIAFAIFEGRNPAPRRNAFLLWLVTGALYFVTVVPLLSYVFQITDWLFVTWWSELLGRVLVIAPLEMFLLYLVLRIGVYPSDTMRTLADGPLYGVAAALGIATAVSLIAVRSQSYANLSLSALDIGENVMAYTALGLWLGYYLSIVRFKRTSVFYLAAGLVLTILLHGLFFFILAFVHAQTYFLFDLSGLILAGLFAVGSLVFIYWRLRKHSKEFIRMAAVVEVQTEQATPKSVLADVVQMVESEELEPQPVPPPPTPSGPAADEDALESLKQSWESLIAEQEADHD